MGAADAFGVKAIAELNRTKGAHEWAVPSFDLTAPLAPGVETAVAFGRGHVHGNDAAAFNGWSDVEWAVKWELLPVPKAGGFGVTIEPVLVVPIGDSAVSGHDWRVELPVVLGWRTGPLTLHAMAGYSASPSNKGDAFLFGTLVTHDVSDRLTVGFELVGNAPVNQPSRYDAMANAGASYAIAEGWSIEARVGRTVRNTDDEKVTNVFFGIEKTF